jgi:hypothetical protein
MKGDLEYSLEKDNSKKSIFITVIGLFILLAGFFILHLTDIPQGLNFLFKNGISEDNTIGLFTLGFIIISILIVLYIRFRPWKYPFKTKWNNEGIAIGYPNGETKEFSWKEVSEIKIEGENWAKILVPYYHVGRFSWSSLFWMISAGVTKPAWKIDFAFFHFKLNNNKIILVPISKENLPKALDIIKSSKYVQTEVETFSETKTKWWLIGPIIFLPVILILITISSSLTRINHSFIWIMICLFAVMPITLLIYIIKSLRKKRALVEGMVVEGFPSYIVNFIYLGVVLFLFGILGLFIFLALGGTPSVPQEYNYSNVTFASRTIDLNNLTLLPSDFVVLRVDSFNSKNYGTNWCSDSSLNQKDTLEIWIKENPILASYVKYTYPRIALNEESPDHIYGPSLDSSSTSYSNQFRFQEGIQPNKANKITLCFYINDTILNRVSNQVCLVPLEISAEC